MLVLTRGVLEDVMIGNDIAVTVLGVEGKKVRLGFSAPKEVPIHRKEIFSKIKTKEMMNIKSITQPISRRKAI